MAAFAKFKPETIKNFTFVYSADARMAKVKPVVFYDFKILELAETF